MLSTATALIQATEESVFDKEIMSFAQDFCEKRENLSEKQFAMLIYSYSCMLASLAVDKAMKVLLTDTEQVELLNAIDELDTMRDEVLNNGE